MLLNRRTAAFCLLALIPLLAFHRPAFGDPEPEVDQDNAAPASHRAIEPKETVTFDRSIDVEEGNLPGVRAVNAFPNLSLIRPVYLTHAPGNDRDLFVILQRGGIVVFENDAEVESAETFLDIRERVFMGHNEEGLLALDFHPDYEENGYFYVWYSANDPRRTVLSRFSRSADDPRRADPDSEKVILEVEQPWGNHNGATVKFGPDGYLYVSIGDGGHAGDPRNYSQNNQSLLGTIIRIDVDHPGEEKPYSIPGDNPFVEDESARDEIWAYGLRNVWRMSFDRQTGDLWAADVGHNAWEAVYVIATPGGNYGWNITEGSQPFRTRTVESTLLDPVIEYSHRQGRSITGGYVYRGEQIEALRGAYVYGDYVTGRVWAITYDDGTVTSHRQILSRDRPLHVASFGEDAAGELYLCAFDRLDGREGTIYRLAE